MFLRWSLGWTQLSRRIWQLYAFWKKIYRNTVRGSTVLGFWKHSCFFFLRYIELYASSQAEWDRVHNRHNRVLPIPIKEGSFIVLMRGLPYSAHEDDCIDFFKDVKPRNKDWENKQSTTPSKANISQPHLPTKISLLIFEKQLNQILFLVVDAN